jgi:glycosyltransferase involved in cell wall biosynthesis
VLDTTQRLDHQMATAASAWPAPIASAKSSEHNRGGGSAAISNIGLGAAGNETRRRHICFVTETYPPEINGVALTLSRLVNGLTGRGHAVSIIRPYQLGVDLIATDSSVILVRGLPLPGYRGLQLGLPAGGLLKRMWTRRRPDVIYVATEGPLGWSAVRTARRLGIAAFSGFHTNYHSYSRHYRVGCFQSLVFRYLRRLHNGTRGTMVPNLDLRDHLQVLGFKDVTFLSRGVDSALFAPKQRSAELRQSWGLCGRQLAVLYVGRIAPEKNLELAVDAYHALYELDNSTRFILVGDGPLRPVLQKKASRPDFLWDEDRASAGSPLCVGGHLLNSQRNRDLR